MIAKAVLPLTAYIGQCLLLVCWLTPSSSAQEKGPLSDRADAAFKKRDLTHAIELYSQLLVMDPRNIDLTYKRALCFIGTSDNERAASELTKVIYANSDNHLAYYNRGIAFAQQARLDEAIADYNAAIEIDRNFAPAHFALSQVLLSRNQIIKGVEHAFEYLIREPQGEYSSAVRSQLAAVNYPVSSPRILKFSDKDDKIFLDLPESWNYRLVDNGDELVMYVTLQRVEDPSEHFSVGVTVTRVRGAGSRFGHSGVSASGLANKFRENCERVVQEQFQFSQYQNPTSFVNGKFVGIMREADLKKDADATMIHRTEIYCSNGTDVLCVLVESPDLLYPFFQATFAKAIGSLQLKD